MRSLPTTGTVFVAAQLYSAAYGATFDTWHSSLSVAVFFFRIEPMSISERHKRGARIVPGSIRKERIEQIAEHLSGEVFTIEGRCRKRLLKVGRLLNSSRRKRRSRGH